MGIIKMRGLPFDVTSEQILDFFKKYSPISHSLKIGYNGGRKSGDASILFSTRKEAKEALELDREKIGTRYIELITISSDEYRRFK
jgi:RNA recognition motif-containing protein